MTAIKLEERKGYGSSAMSACLAHISSVFCFGLEFARVRECIMYLSRRNALRSDHLGDE